MECQQAFMVPFCGVITITKLCHQPEITNCDLLDHIAYGQSPISDITNLQLECPFCLALTIMFYLNFDNSLLPCYVQPSVPIDSVDIRTQLI